MHINHIRYHYLPVLAYSVATINMAMAYAQPGLAFGLKDSNGSDIHALITREALQGTICDGNLGFIERGCISQHAPGSEAAKDKRRHFQDSNLGKSVSYIDREKKTALNYAADADTNVADRARVLDHLGLLVHTAQDFYSRSNWIELKVEQGVGDPYGIELVDWSKVPDGYPELKSGEPELDKGTPDTPEAMKKIVDVSYYKVARALAIRETQRQWSSLETLARNKFGQRATAIITAITQATVPPQTKLDDTE